jgi:hypothetical protein
MLNSKSTLSMALLMTAHLASANSILEQQASDSAIQVSSGTVIREQSIQLQRGGGAFPEQDVSAQEKLAGGMVLEREHLPKLQGVVVDDAKFAGGMILERGGVVVDDAKLAGGMILERGGIKLLGGIIVNDRHTKTLPDAVISELHMTV